MKVYIIYFKTGLGLYAVINISMLATGVKDVPSILELSSSTSPISDIYFKGEVL